LAELVSQSDAPVFGLFYFKKSNLVEGVVMEAIILEVSIKDVSVRP
jgi:hypothetical protein